MKIRKAKKEDFFEASMLVSKTFEKFCSKDGTKKGIKKYIEFHNPKKNLERIKELYSKSEIFFVAVENEKIVGVIRGIPSKIKNLFVEGKFHKKGIAKKLVLKFEKESMKNNSREIKVGASLYAIQFYKSLGYKKTTGLRNFKGIKIQPMRKKLK